MTNSVKAKKMKTPDNSTQRQLAFSAIRDNIIYLKDNSARMVLKCSAINFLLKSQEEQDALIISFQRFLNSLKFPIQILVRSRKLDLNSYLENLKQKAAKQQNTLLQNQTYEYIEYLKKLIEVAQIMKKEFYIIVPIDEVQDESVRDISFFAPFKNFWQSLFGNWVDIVSIKSQIRKHKKIQKELLSRVNSIQMWLENLWIKAQELDKNETVKLLADYYNPRLDNFTEIKQDINNYDLIW